MGFFVYKLTPPRASFLQDQDAEETDMMRRHAGYWSELAARGVVVVFGPVADPQGVWGLAVVEADSAQAVAELGEADPAVTSGVCTYAVFPMPSAVTRH